MTKENDGCLTYCVAKYFNLSPDRVPFFIGYRNYGDYLRAFFKRRGYRISCEWYDIKLLRNKKKLYFVQGLSPRDIQHCVLYKGESPYYDPHFSNLFLKKPQYIWLVTKIK